MRAARGQAYEQRTESEHARHRDQRREMRRQAITLTWLAMLAALSRKKAGEGLELRCAIRTSPALSRERRRGSSRAVRVQVPAIVSRAGWQAIFDRDEDRDRGG